MAEIKACPFCGSRLAAEKWVARALPGGPVMQYYKHPRVGCVLDWLEIGPDEIPSWNAGAPDVVRCRECRKDGLPECPLVFIERQRLVFLNHDPKWFCADGERKAEADDGAG